MIPEVQAALTNVKCGMDIKGMVYCFCLGVAGCDDTPEISPAQKAHGKCVGTPAGAAAEILV